MSTDSLPACRHRAGEFAPGRWICSSRRIVAPKGVSNELCSTICPYVDHANESPACTSIANGSGYGVAIGTYDSAHSLRRRFGTEAVALNLAVLRANCGDEIQILVCDDASPPASQERYKQICSLYGAQFSTNPRRMGHSSGDMVVFHKAIAWAAQLGLRTVTKLSHRMLIDVPQWIQQDSERLIQSGFATQTQMLVNFGVEQIRTECVMMVVDRWRTAAVLDYFRPRLIPYWNESHTYMAIAGYVDRCAPYPHFLPWPRLSYFRGGDHVPVYFRDMQGNAERQFRRLARRYGVPLSRNFSTIDSCQTRDYL